MGTTARTRPARMTARQTTELLDESPVRSRSLWLVPLLAALGTVALLAGVHLAFQPGGGGGGGPDRIYPGPPIPTAVPQAVPIGPETASIDGYADTADGLWITLTVKTLSCTKLVVEPRVTESAEAVTVALARAPGPDRQLFACPTRPYPQRLLVRVPSGLRGRAVVDAADGSVVPVLR